jgi:hypothetical protein
MEATAAALEASDVLRRWANAIVDPGIFEPGSFCATEPLVGAAGRRRGRIRSQAEVACKASPQ